eukprot:6191971-Amphidinium_carterae.1
MPARRALKAIPKPVLGAPKAEAEGQEIYHSTQSVARTKVDDIQMISFEYGIPLFLTVAKIDEIKTFVLSLC